MNRLMRLCVLFLMSLTICGAQQSFAFEGRQFTVKDAIEMTTFSDPYTRRPDADCQRAPDGKHFLVVTTRGVLSTNQLESALWDFPVEVIAGYLHAGTVEAPKPHLLFKIAGTPRAHQFDSYGSLITKAQWSTDSKAVLFLVEQPDGTRRLFRKGLAEVTSTGLSPEGVDVSQFNEAGGTIAYIVAEHIPPKRVVGARINDASTDLTGISLFPILFPKMFPDQSSLRPPLDLWVRYRGANRKVNAGGKWYFPTSASELRVAVSPSGKALIAARPVPEIPAEWLKYKIAENPYDFFPASTGTDGSGRQFTWPWQYTYINLDSMQVVPLVDAPSGFLYGYHDSLNAVWSKDGASVLFTESYLPLRDIAGKYDERNEVACAAAIYTVANGSSSCIAYARYTNQLESLASLAFGSSSNEVRLHWRGKGKDSTEIYENVQGEWRLASRAASERKAQSDLRISIRQDINESPKLWAYDRKTGIAKELWDPNPQFASIDMGQASVYSWKDSTGYEWRAGLVLPTDFVHGHRYPLVIQTHGFGNEHEFLVDGSFTTGFAARPLAAAGIIVLQMDSRSDRYSGSARDEASLEVLGFKSAIDHLNQDGLIDTSRVGIIGFSRTAWYAEESLVLEPDLFHAATIIDGVDMSYMQYMLSAPDSPAAAVEYQAVNGGKPFGPRLDSWVKGAAGFNLNKVQVPVRIEALGEFSVLAEWELYSSLHLQGKPVDLVYIPNAQHVLQQPQDRYASQQGNVDWFRFCLQGYEDPAPSKREQYRRWDKLPHAK